MSVNMTEMTNQLTTKKHSMCTKMYLAYSHEAYHECPCYRNQQD
jgi:hypothetical protein